MTRATLLPLVLVLAFAACHHDKPAAVVKSQPTPPPVAVTEAPKQAPPVAATTNLGVGDDLAKQCKLHLDSVPEAPKFNYDAFVLEPSDRTVLDQVATCLTRGPLAGKSLKLVGHSDPRGTDEYNLGLGDRRAHTVVDYLVRSGVEARRLTASTRGELDATGTDEPGWATDRRVDLELQN